MCGVVGFLGAFAFTSGVVGLVGTFARCAELLTLRPRFAKGAPVRPRHYVLVAYSEWVTNTR